MGPGARYGRPGADEASGPRRRRPGADLYRSDLHCEEALQLGFATRVCEDPRAEALALAAEISGKNPHAIRGAKRLLDLAPDATQAEILMAESKEQTALIGSPNQVEAVMSNMQKRPAVYVD